MSSKCHSLPLPVSLARVSSAPAWAQTNPNSQCPVQGSTLPPAHCTLHIEPCTFHRELTVHCLLHITMIVHIFHTHRCLKVHNGALHVPKRYMYIRKSKSTEECFFVWPKTQEYMYPREFKSAQECPCVCPNKSACAQKRTRVQPCTSKGCLAWVSHCIPRLDPTAKKSQDKVPHSMGASFYWL